jgi:hypothetical protein
MSNRRRVVVERYTHTATDAFHRLREYHEFAFIPDIEMRHAIEACADMMPEINSDLRLHGGHTEKMYDINAVADYLMRTRGFQCVSCGCVTDWNARGAISSNILKSVAQQRQACAGVPLICQPCAVALDKLVDGSSASCGPLCFEMLTRASTGIRNDGFGVEPVVHENVIST